MCIPPYIRYIIEMSIVILAIILFMTEIIDIPVYVLIIVPFVLSFVLKPKCPRCGNNVGTNKYGWTTGTMSKNCAKCGQDLMKCKAEKKKGKK